MADPQAVWLHISWGRVARRIRVPIGFVFAIFYLWRAKPTWRFLVLGALIAAIGLVLRTLASGQVKKNQELTMTGPYAYVRNPLYLGSIVIAIGFAVAARDIWVAIAILVMFALIYVPVIRGEETFLRKQFPAYDDYARRVPSLLPRTLLFRQMRDGFSRELYWQHREYNALLGAAAMLAALVAKILWLHG
ncbi:MAG: isoprenylcysteine carboxylmethyltransferase family protein [Candidatus Korobacteraceae bacterium]|jgi:protein-S-isoprenylcysteine O-methyltransferase Ste14